MEHYIRKLISQGFLRPLIFSIAVFCVGCSWAQLTDVVTGKAIYVDKVYAGLFVAAPLSLDKPPGPTASSLQWGAKVGLLLVPGKLKIQSFGALRWKDSQGLKLLKSYEAIFVPIQSLELKMGVMATPTTTLRPNPISWQSQVETNAESTIPGGQPGIKVKYLFHKDIGLTYGIHKHDGTLLHHLKMTYKQLAISSFLGNKTFFIAAKWSYIGGHSVVTHGKSVSSISSIVPITQKLKVYLDMAYNHAKGKLEFGSWGLRKHFEGLSILRGFLSLNYNRTLRSFQGGVLVHL